MKFAKSFLIAIGVACTIGDATGRMMVVPRYQELLDKSDLVVIATPATKTTDTGEKSVLGYIVSQDAIGNRTPISSIGVETTFDVAVVLKGDKATSKFVLHHYRQASSSLLGDGPFLVFFDPSDLKNAGSYLLFLVREPDGRYAPTGGQTDPGFKAISKVPAEMMNRP